MSNFKLQNMVPFSSGTIQEHRAKIDRFLDAPSRREGDHRDVPLVLTVRGSSRFTYRGITVREWHSENRIRFDSAVELMQ